jgi:hypothetical protein
MGAESAADATSATAPTAIRRARPADVAGVPLMAALQDPG